MDVSDHSIHDEALQQAIDSFWETVPPVWNRIRFNLRATAAEHYGISVEQFHILRHIRKGLGSVSELAEAKQISRPAVSQAVDVLVDKGLVTRKQDEGDRRYVNLVLTAEGDALLNALFKTNRGWMETRMTRLDSDELIRVVAAMEILKKAFVDMDAETK